MTAIENVTLPMDLCRHESGPIPPRKAWSCCGWWVWPSATSTRPSELSGGQQQRRGHRSRPGQRFPPSSWPMSPPATWTSPRARDHHLLKQMSMNDTSPSSQQPTTSKNDQRVGSRHLDSRRPWWDRIEDRDKLTVSSVKCLDMRFNNLVPSILLAAVLQFVVLASGNSSPDRRGRHRLLSGLGDRLARSAGPSRRLITSSNGLPKQG